jgi:hypothetical protein
MRPEAGRYPGAGDSVPASLLDPYPAAVVDGSWEMIAGSRTVAPLTEGVAPELVGPPFNVLRVRLHPQTGWRRGIANLEPRARETTRCAEHMRACNSMMVQPRWCARWGTQPA